MLGQRRATKQVFLMVGHDANRFLIRSFWSLANHGPCLLYTLERMFHVLCTRLSNRVHWSWVYCGRSFFDGQWITITSASRDFCSYPLSFSICRRMAICSDERSDDKRQRQTDKEREEKRQKRRGSEIHEDGRRTNRRVESIWYWTVCWESEILRPTGTESARETDIRTYLDTQREKERDKETRRIDRLTDRYSGGSKNSWRGIKWISKNIPQIVKGKNRN